MMPENLLANYKAKHQHPLNRLSHSIGIPLIVVSLPLFFFNWRWALGLFVVGWVFQFVGHAIEGNQPAFFKNPVYLLVGPMWLLRRAASGLVALPQKVPLLRLCRRMCGEAWPRRERKKGKAGFAPGLASGPINQLHQGPSPNVQFSFDRRGLASPHIRRQSLSKGTFGAQPGLVKPKTSK